MLVCAVVGTVNSDAVVDLARPDVVDEPWFLVVLVGVVVGLLGVTSCVVVAVLYQRHVSRARKSSKQPVIDGQSPLSLTLLWPSPRSSDPALAEHLFPPVTVNFDP